MNSDARNISRSIEAVSKALAEWTVSAQFDADTSLAHRYGEGARRRWVADTQSRIGYLSQSLGVRSPELFADCVLWMRDAFAARGSDQADLELNLRCLRDVIASELPPVVTEAAVPAIEHAMRSLREQTHVPQHGAQGLALQPEASRYLEAVLSGRGEDAMTVIRAQADAGVSVQDIYSNILHPAMYEVGRRWQLNQIGVADEHYATFVTQTAMSHLRPLFPRSARKGWRVLASSVAGDLHEIGVRMVADYFEMDGWDVIFLGANMPVTDMLTTLIERDVHVAALSASSVMHLSAICEAIDAIRSTPGCEGMKVLVGGPPFNRVPGLWKEIGADGSARSAADAVEVGNRLMAGSGDTVRA